MFSLPWFFVNSKFRRFLHQCKAISFQLFLLRIEELQGPLRIWLYESVISRSASLIHKGSFIKKIQKWAEKQKWGRRVILLSPVHYLSALEHGRDLCERESRSAHPPSLTPVFKNKLANASWWERVEAGEGGFAMLEVTEALADHEYSDLSDYNKQGLTLYGWYAITIFRAVIKF